MTDSCWKKGFILLSYLQLSIKVQSLWDHTSVWNNYYVQVLWSSSRRIWLLKLFQITQSKTKIDFIFLTQLSFSNLNNKLLCHINMAFCSWMFNEWAPVGPSHTQYSYLCILLQLIWQSHAISTRLIHKQNLVRPQVLFPVTIFKMIFCILILQFYKFLMIHHRKNYRLSRI